MSDMNAAGRIAVFFIIVLSIWTAMHAFAWWRVSTIPVVAAHVSRGLLLAVFVALWVSYPVSRILDRAGADIVARPLEFVGAAWMGVLFFLLISLLVADVATGFGFLLPKLAPTARTGAVALAAVLSVIALAQGLRAPIVRDYQVRIPTLPPERDGLTVVELSDMHLGTMLGARWLSGVVDRVNALKPDAIFIVGDLIDGNVGKVEPFVPVLRRLAAPLGVWGVTGNHEFYAGLDRSIALYYQAGIRALRDESAQLAPGLAIAGVDDLTARRQFGKDGHPVENALANRPPDATIYLSHTPWQAERAAKLGANLMLCGHTHDGQIWPFQYFVAFTYPLEGGRYDVDGLPVIVCRGTGTWGPRMRLWRPSEIVRVTLHR